MNVTHEEVAQPTRATQEPSSDSAPAHGRILRIRVNEAGKPEVNVKIPLALARLGMKLGAHYAKADLEKHGVDLEQLLKEADTVGKIVDIDDEKAHVEISVE
jgi:hypothetical protein